MEKYQKVYLRGNSGDAWVLVPEHISGDPRPAMLCIPGGGYSCVCSDTEGYPVAERFETLGFRSFILNYRVAPRRYPEPQQDILCSIRLLRRHAGKWGIFPDNIAVCGFSAGGHLCASAGILFDRIPPENDDENSEVSARPDAVVLSYPVITSGPFSHAGSIKNLLGEEYELRKEELSLEKQVRSDTSPMFIWHTLTDQVVPWQNSTLLAEALKNHGIPAELHLFPSGPHGMALGYGREDLARWPEMAASFLRGTLGFRLPAPRKRIVVLSFDDCCRSQLVSAVPILRKYGFRATFFFCRFSDAWRQDHEDTLMTQREAKQLCDAGFEIGNHTWNHPDLRNLSEEEIAAEFDRMENWLRAAGCPPSVSFAYPGGPYAGNAVRVLKERGIRFARTTESGPWTRDTAPMRIPACAISLDHELQFYQALYQAEKGGAAVLVYHGIPEVVHPHCSNSPAFFEQNMKYLHDNGYSVISMREYVEKSF